MISFQFFKHQDVLGLKFANNQIGLPKLSVYLYYIDGLLIDTGQSKARKTILKETEELDVKQMFITHHHEDHSGNISALQELHNCPVFASKKCCDILKNPPKLSFAQQLIWGNRQVAFNLEPIQGALKTRHHHFTIIPIPGHAQDMVALYEPDKKWLFSADLYINSYIGYFKKDESILQQIQSIKQILKLDFEVLFCSHNPQLENGKQKLTEKLVFLEHFYHKVITLYNKGYTTQQIFNQLKLKENKLVKWLSGGDLSKLNMVKSAIRDLNKT